MAYDPSDPNCRPDPDEGWSREVIKLDQAKIVPPVISALVQEAGVLASDDSYCAHGALWRGKRALTTLPPAPAGPLPKLAGKWLYGGLLWVHFGHFLAESTARLWALGQLGSQIDGIVFVPKRPVKADAVQPVHKNFMELLGCDLPIRVLTEPTEVEQLHVPGQGFGLGPMVTGTAEYRSYVRQNFGKDISPDGPERLYISRSKLGARRGGILGEEFLETNLALHGYEVFHPQQHDLQTQVARYKAARQIVALDGSALHLYALVGQADQKVAMIPRRTSSVHHNISNQMAAFCDAPPFVAEAIQTDWVIEARGRPNRNSLGELDMGKLSHLLAKKGFIAAPDGWVQMPWRQSKRALRKLEAAVGEKFVPIHRKAERVKN